MRLYVEESGKRWLNNINFGNHAIQVKVENLCVIGKRFCIFINADLVNLQELDLERTAVGDDGLDILSRTFLVVDCLADI